MKEEFAGIFTETACPTQEQLLAYVAGKLSAEDRHRVEAHLADCELCSEAVEGLTQISQQEKIPAWLRLMRRQLIRKLRRRNRRKRTKEYYLYIAVVALLILMMAIALFWIYHFSR